MDVKFETQKGSVFTIEIGYYDTVLEIKEKIQKYKEIPAALQTLSFNGRVLDDDWDVEKSEILHNSRVRLFIASSSATASPSPEKPKIGVKSEQLSPPAVPRRILLVLRLSSKQRPAMEVELNDTVEQLKHKINEIEGVSIPINRIVLTHSNMELQDHKHIREYSLLTDGSEIDVSIKPAPGHAPPAMAASGPRKLRIFVLPKCSTKKIVMEVNHTDSIQVLRSELEKGQQRMGLQLPSEGYFFIYKQNVMEEKESFLWHRVRQGDTIEIFNGSVSGLSKRNPNLASVARALMMAGGQNDIRNPNLASVARTLRMAGGQNDIRNPNLASVARTLRTAGGQNNALFRKEMLGPFDKLC